MQRPSGSSACRTRWWRFPLVAPRHVEARRSSPADDRSRACGRVAIRVDGVADAPERRAVVAVADDVTVIEPDHHGAFAATIAKGERGVHPAAPRRTIGRLTSTPSGNRVARIGRRSIGVRVVEPCPRPASCRHGTTDAGDEKGACQAAHVELSHAPKSPRAKSSSDCRSSSSSSAYAAGSKLFAALGVGMASPASCHEIGRTGPKTGFSRIHSPRPFFGDSRRGSHGPSRSFVCATCGDGLRSGPSRFRAPASRVVEKKVALIDDAGLRWIHLRALPPIVRLDGTKNCSGRFRRVRPHQVPHVNFITSPRR
jgi:hypothetical protein